jgi:ribosomal protein S8
MKKRHLVSLVVIVKDTLHAFKNADWHNKNAVETASEVIVKRFAKYMKEQEGLEKMGKTEEDFLAPPNGLNQ